MSETNTVNKNDLIFDVAQKTGITQKNATQIVNHIFDTIVESVAKGSKVQITGFGTFEKRARAERTGRNPQTGEAITIPAMSVPGFKAGQNFRREVK